MDTLGLQPMLEMRTASLSMFVMSRFRRTSRVGVYHHRVLAPRSVHAVHAVHPLSMTPTLFSIPQRGKNHRLPMKSHTSSIAMRLKQSVKTASKLIHKLINHHIVYRFITRAICDQDVAAWNATYGPNTRVKCTVIYSEKTGITNLCGHIFRWHLLEYLTLAIDRSWIIGVNPVKSAIDAGYPIEELKTLVENGIDLASLTPRLTGNAPDLTGRKSIPEFSLPTFHQFLVSFIVSDDQVSRVYICAHTSHLIALNSP